jgi:hypothetical protein
MSFQIQQAAFWGVGHHPGMPGGTGCPDLGVPCRVPFGNSDINLTSLMLVSKRLMPAFRVGPSDDAQYLNAIAYGVSGFLTMIICGWGDHMRE